MAGNNNFYFSEIEKIPLLSLEEEKALATKAFSGDKKSLNKLVEHNLRFVVKIANHYKYFMDLEDLITEGNLGLMHAAKKFNPNNGTKFSTYAAWWIKAYIQKAIREVSTGIKFPATKFNEMKDEKWKIISLDKTISNETDETTLASFFKDSRIHNPETEYINQESELQVYKFLSILNKKEQVVLIKRYGLDGNPPMSLSEVGELMGFCKERVRQLEKKALTQIKNYINSSEYYAEYAA